MRKKEQRRQGHSIYTWQDGYWDSVADYNGEYYSWEDWHDISVDDTYDGLHEEEMTDTYDDELIELKKRTNTYEKLEIK